MDKRALLEILNSTFPIAVYKKGVDKDDFIFSGGEQKVIKFIERLTGTELSEPSTVKLQ